MQDPQGSPQAPVPASAPALPRLNEPAPHFEAQTTHGPRNLRDYEGKWLVLFSHPADFTPVCTTEFIAFANHEGDFRRLDCELLGLSVDSTYSHLAWVETIRERFGVEIPFPIIEDLRMEVARRYGMIHEGASTTHAVRALFVIDDHGILRAMVYYPLTTGRSVDEVLRLVEALQTTDREGVSTPEGWRPGEKVIVPPPTTADELRARREAGYECVDWWFCKRDLRREAAPRPA